MWPRYSIFIAALFVTIGLNAQKDVGGYLQVSLGASIPRGEFSATNSLKLSSGYAKEGYAGYAIFGHKVHGNFGMFGMFTVLANGLDRGEFAKDLNTNQPTHQWHVTDRARWTVVGFAFGPHLSLPANKFAFDMRLMAGALNFRSPLIKAIGTPHSSSDNTIALSYTPAEATALAYGGGVTVKYEFYKGIVWIINADYLAGNPRFKNVENTTEMPDIGYKNIVTESYTQKFSMIVLTTGAGFVF